MLIFVLQICYTCSYNKYMDNISKVGVRSSSEPMGFLSVQSSVMDIENLWVPTMEFVITEFYSNLCFMSDRYQ